MKIIEDKVEKAICRRTKIKIKTLRKRRSWGKGLKERESERERDERSIEGKNECETDEIRKYRTMKKVQM